VVFDAPQGCRLNGPTTNVHNAMVVLGYSGQFGAVWWFYLRFARCRTSASVPRLQVLRQKSAEEYAAQALWQRPARRVTPRHPAWHVIFIVLQ
jgi:hypothetical protein